MGGNTTSSRLNISEENMTFYWTPAKTGSVHATSIFSCFSFGLLECSYDRKVIYDYSDFPAHSHTMHLFEGHENYTLICTARNPIKRLFSSFIYVNRFKNEISPKDFRPFFKYAVESEDYLWTGGMINFQRYPDYFIRLESLYDDYMKIPFISNSKFAQCGGLKELCERKKNTTKKFQISIEECYTQDMIDYLYTEYRDYFDKLKYEPKI